MKERGALAFYELTEWTLTLSSGDVATIFADSRGEENGEYVFSLALAGHPPALLPIVRIPASVVRSIATRVGRSKPPGEALGE
jgi:hypothetical protein